MELKINFEKKTSGGRIEGWESCQEGEHVKFLFIAYPGYILNRVRLNGKDIPFELMEGKENFYKAEIAPAEPENEVQAFFMLSLKELRRRSGGMKQAEFARCLGIPLRTYQEWENRKRKIPPYLLEFLEYYVFHENIVVMPEADTEHVGVETGMMELLRKIRET